MSVTRSRLRIVLASLLGSIGLWLFCVSQMPSGGGGGYAALAFSDSVPDREIRARLESTRISGIVSESGQWFLLDSFGSIEQIPLDEYGTRLLPFDPRNDGYAEKLRSVFVRDGSRIVYIPVGSLGSAGYKGKLAAAFEDIPYSIEYTRQGRPLGLLVVLFGLAAVVFCVIPRLRSALRPTAACLLPCLPTLAPLSLGGTAGFTLAALLAGFAVSLADHCLDSVAPPPGSRGVSLSPQQRPALRWLLLITLPICYGITAIVSGFPVLIALLVLALFVFVFALSLRNLSGTAAGKGAVGKTGKGPLVSRRYPGHRRFSPVTIISRKAFNLVFAWAMLPFAAVALFLAVTGAAEPNPAPATDQSFLPPGDIVTEEDFRSHVLFQSSFSLRPLNAPWDPADVSLSVYRLAPDGLPELFSGGEADYDFIPDVFPQRGAPLFPLDGFLRELDKAGSRTVRNVDSRTAAEQVLALLPLLFIIPCLIVRSYSAIFKKQFS